MYFLIIELSYFLIICFQLINVQQMTVLKINMEVREAPWPGDSFWCGFKFCGPLLSMHMPGIAFSLWELETQVTKVSQKYL